MLNNIRKNPPLALAAMASVFALLAGGPALSAEDQKTPEPPKSEDWIDITSWNYADLYDGWRASDLMDADAKGESGQTVGEVEDLIISKSGQIKAVVVEGGGFMDFGDTHARIPWDKVERQASGAISIPFEEADFENGSLLAVDDLPASEGNYRLQELMGDTVRDGAGVGYGYVRDVIFDQEGMAEAVIVHPDYSYGYSGAHPVPYSATGYRPHVTDYWVPYMVEDLTAMKPFDNERFTN